MGATVIDHRITDWLATELIVHYTCGCAFLLRTRKQVSFCQTCPVQLSLEF